MSSENGPEKKEKCSVAESATVQNKTLHAGSRKKILIGFTNNSPN